MRIRTWRKPLVRYYEIFGPKTVFVPVKLGTKKPIHSGWQQTTFKQTQTPEYQAELEINSLGVLLGAASDNLVSIDFDQNEYFERVVELNPWVAEAPQSHAERGRNVFLRIIGPYPEAVYKIKAGGKHIGEWRGGGGAQTVVAGKHPSGCEYRILLEASPPEIEFSFIQWPPEFSQPWDSEPRPASEQAKSEQTGDFHGKLQRRIAAYLDEIPGAVSAQAGHDQTLKVATALVVGFGLGVEGARPWLELYNNKCEPPWSQKELEHKLQEAQANKLGRPWVYLLSDDEVPARVPSEVGEALERSKPLIQLPGNNRPITDFACDLGPILAPHGFYNRAGVCSALQNNHGLEELVVVQAQVLRTALEDYCTPFAKLRTSRGELVSFNKTISLDHIAATVVCPQFLRSLPPLRAFNAAQLPVRRSNGKIELLRPGYDKTSCILTSRHALSYSQNLSAKRAVKFLKALLKEVCFHPKDRERGAAVVLALLLTLYCEHLFSPITLRPGFLFSANAEGAGKTTLGHLAVITHLGVPSLTSMPEDNQELDKKICAASLSGKTVLFFDNTKGHLDSGALEAYMTSPVIEGRILGSSRYFSVQNLLTFIFTGNGATVSPDLRRRLAIVELFLPEAKAEEHVFHHSMSVETIIKKRRNILSALWSLVRSWSEAGSPPPAKSNMFGYNHWSQIVLGVLEHHGWSQFNPMPKNLQHSGDRETLAMHQLLSAMAPKDPYTFEQIVNEARNNDLFDWIIGAQNTELKPDARSKFGKLLKRYDQRLFVFPLEGDITTSFRFEISQKTTNADSRRFTKIPIC